MQLLLYVLQFLCRNCLALICSPAQLVHVVPNGSQLAGYLECSLPINLGRCHSRPLCLLLAEGRHTHSRTFRHLLKFLKFEVAHTKFNLPILFPVLAQNDRPSFPIFNWSNALYSVVLSPSISALRRVGKLRIWYPNTACWGEPQTP